MGFWQNVANTTRNVVWSLPGGREAFPEGNNGTIWWGRGGGAGDHVAGRTVLGSALGGGDTASSAVDGIAGFFGGGRSALDPNRFAGTADAISRRAGEMRPGSVVGRGFLGGRGPTGLSPREPRNPLGYRLGEAPANGRDPNWQMPGTQGGDTSGPQPMRGGRGGYDGMSISMAQGLGESVRRTGDQTRQEAVDMEARMRSRGALLAER